MCGNSLAPDRADLLLDPRSRQPVEPLRTRRPRSAAASRRRLMTGQQLQAALRAGAEGLYALESGTGLLLAHGTWPAREDFRCFVHVADSITDPGIELASINWEAAINALDSGEFPSSS